MIIKRLKGKGQFNVIIVICDYDILYYDTTAEVNKHLCQHHKLNSYTYQHVNTISLSIIFSNPRITEAQIDRQMNRGWMWIYIYIYRQILEVNSQTKYEFIYLLRHYKLFRAYLVSLEIPIDLTTNNKAYVNLYRILNDDNYLQLKMQYNWLINIFLLLFHVKKIFCYYKSIL